MPGTGRTDRPIECADDDQLDRLSFVSRLTDALVTADNRAARSVVVGVTGPWGSGKSSILNLVALEVKARCPEAVVVRFDPWIVSGQQDLILSFMNELIRAVAKQPANARVTLSLIRRLQEYAAHLTPLADLVHKGGGPALRGLVEALHLLVSGDQSLAGRRKKLQELILELKAPIVVLIDELDRVEDEEVRAVAQLVRAVGDFQGISYLLAYDPARVARALGCGRNAEHGRSYLEKIVQLPIALPVALPEELRSILDAETDAVCKDLGFSPITRDSHYSTIADAITPALASTPRDIKRLVGIFQPLAAMVGNEVDLVDVLGFAALMAKAPQTIEQLSQYPERLVDDPLTYAENKRRSDVHAGRSSAPGATFPEPKAQALLSRMFPALSRRRSDEPPHPKAISRRHGLMTVLRLGLLPGAMSSSEAAELLGGRADFVEQRLSDALADDKLSELVDRLADIYPGRFGLDDLEFWKGAARFLNRRDFQIEDRFGRVSNLADALAQMLHEAAAHQPDLVGKAEHIVESLIAVDDLMLAPRMVLDHFHIHGIGANGYATFSARGGPWFLSDLTTASLANNLVGRWRTAIERGEFFERLSSAAPLFVMKRYGGWDSVCRDSLRKILPEYITTLGPMLFPPNASVDAEWIQELCGLREFLDAVHRARSDRTLPNVEADALTKAVAKLPDPGPLKDTRPRTSSRARKVQNANVAVGIKRG